MTFELIIEDPNTGMETSAGEYDELEDAEYDAIGYEDEGHITRVISNSFTKE